MKIYINNKIVESEAAAISVFDRGFLYGDGAFESLRTYQGKPFLLEQHLKRLLGALRQLRIAPPLPALEFKKAVLKTLAANNLKEAYIKIIVTRGTAKGHGLSPKNRQGKSTIIIIVEKLADQPKKIFVSGWSAIISVISKSDLPTDRLKSLCYLDNVLAKLEAERGGADEAFLLDKKGNLAEGTVSNIFIVKNNTIYTPPKSAPILAGVTREYVLKMAKQSAFMATEKIISIKELYNADECFITLSSLGIVPITKIWKKKVGQGICGPITKRLIDLYGKST